MNRKTQISKLDAEAFLAEIAKRLPMAKGSLAEVRKPCIRPNCRRCASGEKHPAFIFAFTENRRRRCMYVPKKLVPKLRKAIKNGRWLEDQLKMMGKNIIEQYREQVGKENG